MTARTPKRYKLMQLIGGVIFGGAAILTLGEVGGPLMVLWLWLGLGLFMLERFLPWWSEG